MTDSETWPAHAEELRLRAEKAAGKGLAPAAQHDTCQSPEASLRLIHELHVHQIELEMQNEELRRSQTELEAARERYFDLYDLAPVGYVTVTENGLIVEANLTAAMLLGVGRTALVKERFARFIAKEDQDLHYLRSRDLFVAGAPQTYPLRMVREDGTHFWARVHAAPSGDENGARTCRMVLSDITELVQAQEEARIHRERLVQSDKLASLGILVAGVAHEINNPNHSIMANVQTLSEVWTSARPILDRFYEDFGDFVLGGYEYSECRDKLPDMFASALASSNRIKSIVTELREFVQHRPMHSMLPFDVNAAVKSAIILMSNLIAKATDHFSVEYEENLPPVTGNLQRIEQVVINLIQNACQALESRDKSLRVATFYDEPSKSVFVLVCDDGVGIPEENERLLGTPFFTTKRDAKGMGLGLWICSNIVHEHGGTLTFSPRERGGTRATLALPASEHPATNESAEYVV